jgi:hypothetical protein
MNPMATSEQVAAARLVARDAAVRDTRAALRSWLRSPAQLAPWVGLSALIAALLLVATFVVALVATPHPGGGTLIAADPSTRLSDGLFVLGRNLTVLALHLMVCLATYLVRRSLPLQATGLRGVQGWVHRHAAGPALLVVVLLTLFSLVQQALALGQALADSSASEGLSVAGLLLRLLPHAAPELVAVFLPLAAVIWLEHRGRGRELLAAIAACTIVAVPVVALSAWLEVAVASRFF